MVETTGPAAVLHLIPDCVSLAGDSEDAEPVTIEVVDAQGWGNSEENEV